MIHFEWDPAKARSNDRKHGINFDDAMLVFEDPYALFEQDRIDETGQRRWQALGFAGGIAIVLVAHTVRDEGEIIRIISARLATRKERNRYEQTRTQDAD